MVRLPQIVGNVWFNNKMFSSIDMTNKVVLVDFWTYSCVNCLRTIPYLKEWWQKYNKDNFLIVGIHTPEFEFEKDPLSVSKAVKDLGIEWPVVLDNEYINWKNFANQYWPAKYLADHTGNIVYEHFGEGEYEKTESFIQTLLKNINANIALPKLTVSNTGNICYISTPETYCGYLRGDISNPLGLVADKEHYYSLLDDPETDSLGLSGTFISRSEYLESKDPNSRLLLHFKASEVNLVLTPIDPQTTVQILLNYKPLPPKFRGEDLDDSSQMKIDTPRMYQLLKSNVFSEGILSIQPVIGNFKAYAFTFSGCID